MQPTQPIRVYVFRRQGRKHFEAQWVDPATGLKKTRTTGTSVRREAERFAGRLETQLNSGGLKAPVRLTWQEFRERYKAEVLAGQRDKTRRKMISTFNALERLIRPARLASLDETTIGSFGAKLRSEQRKGKRRGKPLSEYTIRGHLSNVRTLLNWAAEMKLLQEVPAIRMPELDDDGMKGRPVTGEEFDRMLAKTKDVVGAESAASWKFLLEGLWWSGLRLEEAMALHWRDDANLCVDLDGHQRPMFCIRAHAEKGKRQRVLPMAPEFAQLLEQTPKESRRGFVFNPRPLRKPFDVRLRTDSVSKRISAIGKQARVRVGSKDASAHDLRRSFGTRWAARVLPPVLMELMRHESIQTTMKFYVGRNAEAAAQAMWSAFANNPTNTAPESPEPGETLSS